MTDSRTHLPGVAQAEIFYVRVPSADLRTEFGMGTQALAGQRFAVIESKGGQSHGALFSILQGVDRVDYVGVLPTSVLTSDVLTPTYIVTAVAAAIFREADFKSELLGSFPRNAVLGGDLEGQFLKLPQGGFVHAQHIRTMEETIDRSFTDIASDMLGLPYIWGGTGHIGVDCSGLVQSALAAIGVDAPRDADQQEGELGRPVDFTDRAVGDLVFWPGHVGIIAEGDNLLHANAHHMRVALEPVDCAVSRIGPVRATKRI